MSKWIGRLESLAQIETIEGCQVDGWEGYYWLSDQDRPCAIISTSDLEGNELSYVVEALLQQGDHRLHIVHVGEGHQITHYDLSMVPSDAQVDMQDYYSHRLDHGRIRFRRIWLPEKDDLCDGLPVLRMKAFVFDGLHD